MYENALDGVLFEERIVDLDCLLSNHDGDERMKVWIAAANAKGELPLSRDEGGVDIRRHMSTDYAARDVLETLKRACHSSKSFECYEIPKPKFI